jgi:hypothetical protein
MDKILRIDNRAGDHVRELIDWSTQDNFWQANILSPAALRRNLDRLELQMEKDWHWQNNKLQRMQSQREGPTMKEQYLKGQHEAGQ